jgi:hypothetical protein
MRRAARNPLALWSSFIFAHLWLGLLNLYGPGLPLGDVTIVYKFWTDQIVIAGFWVGIHSPWVYPILAIFPMLAADMFGPTLYASTWLSMILLFDAVAFFALTGRKRESRNVVAAWWWIVFLVLLGPISLGRIDSVTVALAIVGVLCIAGRPLLATVILTVAAWVKVWPAAIIVAMVVAVKERWRVLAAALSLSALIAAIALLWGSGANVLSFIGQQTGRGLQVESPVSTIWLWQAFSGVSGTNLYYDQHILTWQVTGNGTGTASALMTPIMALVVVAVVLIAVLALRRGAEVAPLLATLVLALVSALIAFNKVGSPQFVAWLAVPVVLGLTTRHGADRWWFAVPAWMVLVTAGLTQVIYPFLYGWLLSLHPFMLVVLSARNILVFAIFGWAVMTLWRLDTNGPESVEPPGDPVAEPTSWPLDR